MGIRTNRNQEEGEGEEFRYMTVRYALAVLFLVLCACPFGIHASGALHLLVYARICLYMGMRVHVFVFVHEHGWCILPSSERAA